VPRSAPRERDRGDDKAYEGVHDRPSGSKGAAQREPGHDSTHDDAAREPNDGQPPIEGEETQDEPRDTRDPTAALSRVVLIVVSNIAFIAAAEQVPSRGVP